MHVKDYNQNYDGDSSNLLSKLGLEHPERIVVEDKSIHQITNDREIDAQKMTVQAQQRELSDIANKSNLLSCQMEKLLDDNNKNGPYEKTTKI